MRGGGWQVGVVLIALSIGALSFVYRFNTLGGPLAGFDNDHFFQIVRAEAMLDGELPLRDYADAELRALWPPLTYATSAVAMQAMGRSLRSEAILTAGMLALGAAALYWVSATVAQGMLPAALATLLAVGLSPTLYNYPKIVPYAFAVIAMLAYARRPGRWRILALALTIVVATLYRHDHGVYLSLASLALIVLVHQRAAARPLLTCAALVLAGLLPGLVFAQQHGGLIKYLRECLATSRSETARTADAPLPFQVDLSQPWLARQPAPPAPPPRVAVRWDASVTPEARAVAERELGLADPEARSDGVSWSYAIEGSPSSTRLAALIQDARVADTSGIDRQAFVLTATPPAGPVRGGLFGWKVAPGVLREANATPWLLLVGWSVVLVSLACVAWPPLRRAVARPDVPPAAIAAIGVLGVLLCLVFLRNPSPSRLPDVSVPVTVLGAWLLTALPRAVRSGPRPARAAVALLLATAMGFTILSVGVVGTVPAQVAGTGVAEGATGVLRRWQDVSRTLGGLPETTSGVDATLGDAASYLRRCTVPSDRLLVGDILPEVNYFARRGVAAGQMVFFGGFYAWDEAERAAIAHWETQSVPLVLMQTPERFDDEFGSDYPALATYLRAHYRPAGRLDVRRDTALDVWVVADRQGTIDPGTDLPCFGATTPTP